MTVVAAACAASLPSNETNKVSEDWIHSLAVHMVTLLRQLDPELAKLDEEQATSSSLPKETEDDQNNKSENKEQQLRDMEDALGELLARVGTDATSFVEQCRAHVLEHKLRLENTAKSAVSCHEYAVLPLVELLDPEPDVVVPAHGDDDDVRDIVIAPRLPLLGASPPLLLEPSSAQKSTDATTTTVVQPAVVQNHFWQWNAGDVFNHHGGCGGDTTSSLVHASTSAVVHRSASFSDTARLETLKKDTRDWQANIASLTSILQQLPTSATTTILDTGRIERQLQLSLDAYLDTNAAYQQALQKQQQQQQLQSTKQTTGLIEY
jgi:hypothetical protein